MTRHISEVTQNSERILIIEKKQSLIFSKLKKHLEGYDIILQRSPMLPPQYNKFSRIFFLDDTFDSSVNFSSSVRVTVIHIQPYGKTVTIPHAQFTNIKHIILSHSNISDDELTQILWFSLSSTEESVLDMRKKNTSNRSGNTSTHTNGNHFSRKQIFRYLLYGFLIVMFAFTIPLAIALRLNTSLLTSYTKGTNSTSGYLHPVSGFFTQLAAALYAPARPIYSLFNLALVPDTLIRLNSNVQEYSRQSEQLVVLQRKTFTDLALPTKIPYKVSVVSQDLTSLDEVNVQFQNYSDRLVATIPSFFPSSASLKNEIQQSRKTSQKLSRIIPVVKTVIQNPSPQRIMVLVIDNGTLRGSGGVINAVGLVTIEKGSITSSDFFNAAQLETPVNLDKIAGFLTAGKPGDVTYLNDATTPIDLFETQTKMKSYMASVTGSSDVDGTIVLTTSGIQNILSAFPDLYLSGEKEKINEENITLKYQLHKNNRYFIPHLLSHMVQTLGTVSPNAITRALIVSLDEKQLAFLSDDASVQEILDSLYWSGKTISPQCIGEFDTCINDYLFSIDQDLSDRNGPAYIQKQQSKSVRFSDENTMTSTVRITWKNSSPLPDEQGGLYHVYTQVLLPPNSSVTQITKNSVLVEDLDELTGKFKILGIHLDVPARKNVELTIRYTLPVRLKPVTNYQLITQKQFGGFTSNISFEAILPVNYSVGAKNIDPVVNNGRIFYNTTLNTDKLFFLEIKKKGI